MPFPEVEVGKASIFQATSIEIPPNSALLKILVITRTRLNSFVKT
jgi:hypothetical protein